MTENTRYQAILADLDGTMNRGDVLIPGAKSRYEELSKRGIHWLFLSNNATCPAAHIAANVHRLGLDVSEDQVVNSAAALIHELTEEHAGAGVLVVGEAKLLDAMKQAGIRLVEEPDEADILVAAMDRTFTYDKLARAQAAIRRGALFWATNRDATLPVEGGLLPGAGSVVAAIATAAGREPDRVLGKPSPDMAELALAILGLPRAASLVVGDRMETDILFARNAGIDSALVLTGASSREDLPAFSYSPTHLFESIAEIDSLFD
ncbi:MAG: HAD-IIA family hydrolase [Deltaproteobacteria bacterium]